MDERGFCVNEVVRCFSWPIMACQREGEVEGEEKIFWEIFVVEENGRKEKDNLGKTCGCGGRKE